MDPEAQIVGEFVKSIEGRRHARAGGAVVDGPPRGDQAPIASATSVTQLKEILGAIDLKLSDDATAELDRASAWKEAV